MLDLGSGSKRNYSRRWEWWHVQLQGEHEVQDSAKDPSVELAGQPTITRNTSSTKSPTAMSFRGMAKDLSDHS